MPTAIEVSPKEDNITFDQYAKALVHIGTVPDTEGRSMTTRSYCLMELMTDFLDQLWTLDTATEQATQTFATGQGEELFYLQLGALLITWLTNKLPEVVRKRAQNRRPQPSARILLTELCFTLLPQPGDQAKHLGSISRNPTSSRPPMLSLTSRLGEPPSSC